MKNVVMVKLIPDMRSETSSDLIIIESTDGTSPLLGITRPTILGCTVQQALLDVDLLSIWIDPFSMAFGAGEFNNLALECL